MAERTPLSDQLEVVERLLARAKAEKDWPTIASLKATADLIRWTMANAEALKVAATVIRDPRSRFASRQASVLTFLHPAARSVILTTT
jgi:hypothetical protein